MKIISWNVNGIRAAYKNNFVKQLEQIDADIICLQEIKIDEEQLSPDLFSSHPFEIRGYHTYFNSAIKKGYSGVAMYTKKKPLEIYRQLGVKRFDREGRILKLQYPGFTLINFYIPHGGREKENLDYKLEVYSTIIKYLSATSNQNIILAGDFNIAHRELDLARPQDNQNNTMFTPIERRQLDKITELGFADSFRKFHSEGGHYTWWPYRVDARARNLGWRLDYIFTSKTLVPKLNGAFIMPEVTGSDHCPVGVEIENEPL